MAVPKSSATSSNMGSSMGVRTSGSVTGASPARMRWPLSYVSAADGAPSARRSWQRLMAVSAALLLIGAAIALPSPLALRIALVTLGMVGFVVAGLSLLLRRPKRPADPPTYLEANDQGIDRVTADGSKALVRWDAPFGVTLFASYGRPTGLLAFTSPTQTRYVPTRIDDRNEADDELLSRIAVLADLDLVEGIGQDAALASGTAAHLVRHLEAREKQALGRVFLSDGRRTPISLDRATLAVGERAFDLSSPLEWRALMFHESTGQGPALYQATWVRQGASELVLVAPMPASILPREQGSHRDGAGKLGQALTRDLKLVQAPAEPPPAREMRVAIDRPFMMAVRRALADAPLASRSPTSQTSRSAPDVRGQIQ